MSFTMFFVPLWTYQEWCKSLGFLPGFYAAQYWEQCLRAHLPAPQSSAEFEL
jgi:hypothetical protein